MKIVKEGKVVIEAGRILITEWVVEDCNSSQLFQYALQQAMNVLSRETVSKDQP